MRGAQTKTKIPGKKMPKRIVLFSWEVKRGAKDRNGSTGFNRPPLRIDRRRYKTPKINRSTPISPGKIPGLSINSPRLGMMKESRLTKTERAITKRATIASRSFFDMKWTSFYFP
jgi:hypothetical protein